MAQNFVEEFLYQFIFQSGTHILLLHKLPYVLLGQTASLKRQKDPFAVVFIFPGSDDICRNGVYDISYRVVGDCRAWEGHLIERNNFPNIQMLSREI